MNSEEEMDGKVVVLPACRPDKNTAFALQKPVAIRL